jgi:hypothetical protein
LATRKLSVHQQCFNAHPTRFSLVENRGQRPEKSCIKKGTGKIKDRTGVIDVIAEDTKTGEVVLVMNEPEPWEDSDERLLALQERFNAYASFLLDGEIVEAHPELVGKPARIELRCAKMPDTRALDLLGMIHDQLAFQEIKMEVVVRDVE